MKTLLGAHTAVNVRIAACVLLWIVATTSQAAAVTLNMSRDLVSVGIAARNMTPNDPSLDARPLFQAAMDYVRNHSIATVTVDPGAYYFLTTQYPNDYLIVPQLSNVTIDMAGATIFLKDPWAAGLHFWYCDHLTLTNVTIDYINTPYTHVQLTSVDSANRVLHYTPVNGWPDPAVFSAYASANELSPVVAVAFRSGRIVPGTSRMPLQAPVGGGSLPLFQNYAPWTQGATLSTLQAGDTIVVTFRGGAAGPLKVWHGDSVLLSNVTIHGANNWAIEVVQSSNTTIDHARVEPRPGTLIGSSADGIHFTDGLRNNHIRNSFVTSTVDDALVMDSLAVATVTAPNSGSALSVARNAFSRFPDGTAVNFVDTATGSEMTGGTIVSQIPADTLSPGFGETVMLTFSQPLPSLTAGMRMVFADATMRGSGSTIEDNVVENVLMGRGVWIGGSRGVTIQRNVIRNTSSGGVVLFQDTIHDIGPPAHDIVIRDNRFESNLGPMASGSLTQFAMAAVVVDTVITDSFRFAPGAVNSNIAVVGNTIVDSGRGGIWMGETNGGTIASNRIVSWRQHPELPIFAVPGDLQSQVLQDITQPIVVRYSSGQAIENNAIGCASFTDDPIVVGGTTIKAVHVIELRACADGLRMHFGLPAYAYSEPSLAEGTIVKAQHIQELRTAVSEALTAGGLSVPLFTDVSLSGQPIRATHLRELRSAIATRDSLLH
jgi:hypothetical protein